MKHKIITFSFDDGVMQDLKIIEILNKYNLKATFNLNTGNFGKSFPLVWEGVNVERKVILPEMVKKAYKGHEVAVHTVHHSKLKLLSDDEIVNEIVEDINNLEILVGYEVRGMAYPCSEFDERVIRVIKERTPIKYARTVVSSYNLNLQKNLLCFNPTCRYGDNQMYELADELFACKTDESKLLYIWTHSYEFDYNPSKYEEFERFCAYISGRNNIEYCTNIEAFRKLKQI